MDGINWGGLQSRNIFADFVGGADAGRQARAADAKRRAMNLFATDPAGAEQALIAAGDFDTAEAMAKRRERETDRKTKAAVGGMVAKGDLKGAQSAAASAGDFDMVTSIGKMDETQRKAARERAEVLGAYAQSLRDVPYGEARTRLQQDKEALLQLGLTPEQIDGFDPTPQNIQSVMAQAMDLKTALDQAHKDRTFGLQQEQFGEQKRANRAREGISRGQLGVAQGGLAVRQQAHQARLKAGGYGTPGVGGVLGPTLDPDEWEYE